MASGGLNGTLRVFAPEARYTIRQGWLEVDALLQLGSPLCTNHVAPSLWLPRELNHDADRMADWARRCCAPRQGWFWITEGFSWTDGGAVIFADASLREKAAGMGVTLKQGTDTVAQAGWKAWPWRSCISSAEAEALLLGLRLWHRMFAAEKGLPVPPWPPGLAMGRSGSRLLG